jgi:hypothetical protein
LFVALQLLFRRIHLRSAPFWLTFHLPLRARVLWWFALASSRGERHGRAVSLTPLPDRRAHKFINTGYPMGIFRKSAVEQLESEIDQLHTRRKLLARQREAADAALQKALADRRKRLLEDDLDRSNGERGPVRALIERLRDENDSITDALNSLDAKLAEAETKLAQARERGKRDAERQHRQEQLDAARAARNEFKEVAARMVEALAPLAPIGVMSAAAHVNLQYLAGELTKGFDAAFTEVQSYISMVTAGEAAIKAEPVVLPSAPPPAPIERRSVTLLQASRWMDVDGIRTGGKLSEADLPLAVAEKALAYGYALETGSDAVRRMLETTGRDYAPQLPQHCVDITRPAPAPGLPPDAHATEPPLHSALVPPAGPYQGAAMIGTAAASRAR